MRVVLSALGILLVVAVAYYLWASDSGISAARGKRTMSIMATMAEEIESQWEERGRPPREQVLEALKARNSAFVRQDAWGNNIDLFVEGESCFIVSHGADGRADYSDPREYHPGPTSDPSGDIVILNDKFIRYPAGYKPPSIVVRRSASAPTP